MRGNGLLNFVKHSAEAGRESKGKRMGDCILVVDGAATSRIIMKVRLASACYEVATAPSLDEALATLRRTTPQVILVGGAAGDNSVVLCCARLAAETMGTVPVIAITDPQDRVRALRAGASAAMDRPVDESLLLARIRGLVRDGQGMLPVAGPLPVGGGAFQPIGLAEAAAAFAGPGAGAADLQGAEIVLVGQAGAGSLLWRRAVQARLNVSVRFCEADRALSDAAQGRAADLYLIAGGGGGGAAGLQLMSELRSRPASREASIVVLLPADRADLASVALDLGANDVLSDPPDPDHEEEIALRIAAQLRRKRTADRSRQAAARDRRWAWTDPLTDLPNRRHFLARMEELGAAGTARSSLAVIALDIDRFKLVNDLHGHAAGDEVLRAVAGRMLAALPDGALLARVGGEEFLAVLPGGGARAGCDLADRLRGVVSDRPVRLPDCAGGGTLAVTVSAGIAIDDEGLCASAAGIELLLSRADTAMRQAKRSGRDRSVRHGQPVAA